MEELIVVLLVLFIPCVLTILLESVPVLFLRQRKAWWKASVICNVVTNPPLNTIMLLLSSFMMGSDGWYLAVVAVLEIAVLFLETYFYKKMMNKSYACCFWVSFAANAISLFVGVVVIRQLLLAFPHEPPVRDWKQ